MVNLSFLNPFSNKYHALDDFKKVERRHQALIIFVTLLITVISAGFATTPYFRALVNNFKKMDPNDDPTTQKSDQLGKEILNQKSTPSPIIEISLPKQEKPQNQEHAQDIQSPKPVNEPTTSLNAPINIEYNGFESSIPDSFKKKLEMKLKQCPGKNVFICYVDARADLEIGFKFKKFQEKHKNVIFMFFQSALRHEFNDVESLVSNYGGASLKDPKYPTLLLFPIVKTQYNLSGMTNETNRFVENEDEILAQIK